MTEILFWVLATLAVYSYFLYPLLLMVATRGRAAARPTALSHPAHLSMIITAHNEKNRIVEKLENTLAIDWADLQVIVASDCSTDDTDDIVRRYASRGIGLVRAEERLGKENAQLGAVKVAAGEIIVFSDVATRIPPEALRKLAAYFGDPSVGAVSSEDRFISRDGRVVGEGAYVRYEMGLRGMESKLGGLVGLSGSFFAARRSVCDDWDVHSPSDFNIALNCARLGLRAVTAPDVLGIYSDLKDPKLEYQRKVRTVLRGITAIGRHADILNIWRYGTFSWQVWSHKIMRWAVPVFLIGLLLANIVLMSHSMFYKGALIAQLAFYLVAIIGALASATRSVTLVNIIYFFMQANVAVLQAAWRYSTGHRMTTWQPSTR